MYKYILAIFLAFSPLCVAHAAEVEAQFISADEYSRMRPTVERVEKYLTGITTLIADFTQVAPNGAIATGKFYMSRPGKMRWQYNPPTPILMVSNGSEFVFYDYELEQVSYVPLDSTLLSFLAKADIKLNDENIGITNYQDEAGMIRIELAQRDKPKEGKLQLEFTDKPMAIKSFVVTDATGQVTKVTLNNALFGTAIDKEKFIFRDPRKSRRN